MITAREKSGDDGAMLHPELRAEHDPDAIIRDGLPWILERGATGL
jgi:hypothetical protein